MYSDSKISFIGISEWEVEKESPKLGNLEETRIMKRSYKDL